MNNYLVVPGGIVAMKSRIAVGFSSQFLTCRLHVRQEATFAPRPARRNLQFN
jgi:hypothetical protein